MPKVTQHNLDRIIFINIDIRGKRGIIVTKCLTCELMGKHSNIIFTENKQIIDAIKHVGPQTSRFRTVLPHKEYFLPPGQNKLNILTASPAEILNPLQRSSAETLQAAIISSYDGAGPVTAREIIYQAGLPAGIGTAALDNADYAAIVEAATNITGRINTGLLQPTVLIDFHNKGIAIAAWPVQHLRDCQAHSFTDFFTALNFTISLRVADVCLTKTFYLNLSALN